MKNRHFKQLSIWLIGAWLVLFAVLPLLQLLRISFSGNLDGGFSHHLSLEAYITAFNPIYLRIFYHSLGWSLLTTTLCLLISYPFAYILAKTPKTIRPLCLLLVIIPFWTSSLIRTYAMMTIIKAHGLLNYWLMRWDIIHQPLHILYTPIAVEIGLIYSLLPFMILPIYANLEKFDWRLVEAARDLGATPWRAFLKVVLPVSMPGVISGIFLVFLPAMTLFYIPDILGGAKSFLVGNLIQYQFLDGSNWPLGAALSTLLLVILSIMIALLKKLSGRTNQALGL